MFKATLRLIDWLIYGDGDIYYCTKCGATKHDIWTGGCRSAKPCEVAPLEFSSPFRRFLANTCGIVLT